MFVSLIVIRSAEMEKLVSFYALFGLKWDYHKHGNSPYHYSANLRETVIEIYPLAKGQSMIDKYLRIGFSVDDFDLLIARLNNAGVIFIAKPSETDFGINAIVEDPEGRKVEIYKARSS